MNVQSTVLMSLLAVLLLWGGRLVAGIVFIVGLFRLIFGTAHDGLVTLGWAVLIAVVTRLLGALLLMTTAASAARAAASGMGGMGMGTGMGGMPPGMNPGPGRSGNVYDGEVVESGTEAGRRPTRLPADRR